MISDDRFRDEADGSTNHIGRSGPVLDASV